MQRIRIQGDRFLCGDQPFIAWGFNYWHSQSPGSDPDGGDWSVFCRYDPELIEREVAAMAAAGANTVRVWFAYGPEHWTADQHLSPAGRQRVRHFFDVCRKARVYVLLTVGGAGSQWGAMRGYGDVFSNTASRFYCDEGQQREFLADVRTLMDEGGLAGQTNLLAIDLANEPIFGVPQDAGNPPGAVWKNALGLDFKQSLEHPPTRAAWRSWVIERYGSVAEACRRWECGSVPAEADGTPPRPTAADVLGPGGRVRLAADYHAFVESRFRAHCVGMGRALRTRYPGVLVTLGLGCGGTGAEFEGGSERERFASLMLTQNLREMREGLDFLCVHGYNELSAERLEFLRRYAGSGQPVVIEEFGHIPQTVDPVSGSETPRDFEAQRKLWDEVLGAVRTYNFAGALGCQYVDTGNPEPSRNTWSRMGVAKRGGEPKPALSTFRDHATRREPAAGFHPECLPYPDGLFANPVRRFGAMFKEWRAGRRKD